MSSPTTPTNTNKRKFDETTTSTTTTSTTASTATTSSSSTPKTMIPKQILKKPAVMKTISSAPVKYNTQSTTISKPPTINYVNTPTTTSTFSSNLASASAPSYQDAMKSVETTKSTPQYVFPQNAPKSKDQTGNYQPRFFRKAAADSWEDNSLSDWPENDHRLFIGDLGNEVTDEMLIRIFNKYPTFQRARVIRDKRTTKSRGFAFVSFGDPTDMVHAIKEQNGKYIGNRPCKIKKSRWKDRLDEERIEKDKNWQTNKKPLLNAQYTASTTATTYNYPTPDSSYGYEYDYSNVDQQQQYYQ